MSRPPYRRHATATAVALALIAATPPASGAAGLELPADPTGVLPGCLPGGLPDLSGCLPGGELPGEVPGDLPGEVPGEVPGELPGDLPGELPVGLPGELPVGLPGGGDPSPGGGAPGDGSGPTGEAGGALDAAGPVIAGPGKAPTVRVDSRGRFRVGGVTVTCPAGCRLSVKVRGADGRSFVARTFDVRAGAPLQLKKLKVSKKSQRALRSMGVARVTASLKASPAGGASVARRIGMKLKPAKR